MFAEKIKFRQGGDRLCLLPISQNGSSTFSRDVLIGSWAFFRETSYTCSSWCDVSLRGIGYVHAGCRASNSAG